MELYQPLDPMEPIMEKNRGTKGCVVISSLAIVVLLFNTIWKHPVYHSMDAPQQLLKFELIKKELTKRKAKVDSFCSKHPTNSKESRFLKKQIHDSFTFCM